MNPRILDCIQFGRRLKLRHNSGTIIKSKDGIIVWYKQLYSRLLILHVKYI